MNPTDRTLTAADLTVVEGGRPEAAPLDSRTIDDMTLDEAVEAVMAEMERMMSARVVTLEEATQLNLALTCGEALSPENQDRVLFTLTSLWERFGALVSDDNGELLATIKETWPATQRLLFARALMEGIRPELEALSANQKPATA